MKLDRSSLAALRQEGKDKLKTKKRVLVCAGTGCVANGSLAIYNRLCELVKEQGLAVEVIARGKTASMSQKAAVTVLRNGDLWFELNQSAFSTRKSSWKMWKRSWRALLKGRDRRKADLPSSSYQKSYARKRTSPSIKSSTATPSLSAAI